MLIIVLGLSLIHILVSIVVLMGSIMGIMNFHADVNMIHSQSTMVNALTKNPKKYLPYFQIPYSIGIGVGAVSYTHLITLNKKVCMYLLDQLVHLRKKVAMY